MTTNNDLYKNSGVDVAKGDELVAWLQSGANIPQAQVYGEVVAGIGGFAALYRPRFVHMDDPLLVSGTDGVGTKVLLGIESDRLDGLGIDLVAMCANDVYTLGAQPLFFLDYYATGKLEGAAFKRVLSSIREGCRQCGAALMGGETAEMPGLYARGHFDLAGFLVGVVDGKKLLGPQRVRPGDCLYALPSTGFHSNGYSLVRKWVSSVKPEPKTLDLLMRPTKIYGEIPTLLERLHHKGVHALANITGGGISGNLPRVIPPGLSCEISQAALPTPAWMSEFIAANGATFAQVEGTFNMGVGMIAVVAADATSAFEEVANALGLAPVAIGRVVQGRTDQESEVVYV